MNPIIPSVAALSVSLIYVVYDAYRQLQFRRQRMLRERVAFMLWTMATREEEAA